MTQVNSTLRPQEQGASNRSQHHFINNNTIAQFIFNNMESDIVLGFLEEPKNQAITQAKFLPSKVGGAPAWISEQGKPGDRCGHCSYKLIFLMQLYANQDEEDPDLHRMLYVFACLSP
jgi:hypothetical protein